MTTYGVAARRNSTEPGSMAYMAKDGPDITQKVLGDEAFNNKWGCKNNIEPDTELARNSTHIWDISYINCGY